MLEDGLGQGSNRGEQVLETSVGRKVLHHGHAAFGTVVERVVDSDVLLRDA